MDLFESISVDNSFKSIFSEHKISGKDLQLILEYASWAPSPYNSQPWEFIIVQEREHIRQIASIISPAVDPLQTSVNSGQIKEYLKNLPNLLFYLMDTTRRDPGENFYKLGLVCMGAALANLVHAASEKGIGMRPFDTASGKELHLSNLKNYLRIPDKTVICCFFGLGYLKDKKNPAESKTADRLIVHNNRFGNPRETDKLNPNPINHSRFFLIRDRRSYRYKFLERPISLRDEDNLIKAAMNSFNVNNKRVLELIFIKDKPLIDSLADLITKISFELHLKTEYSQRVNTWTRYTQKEERKKTDGVLIILWKRFLGHLLKGMMLILEKFTVLRPVRELIVKNHSNPHNS